jgi:hypothetical protein
LFAECKHTTGRGAFAAGRGLLGGGRTLTQATDREEIQKQSHTVQSGGQGQWKWQTIKQGKKKKKKEEGNTCTHTTIKNLPTSRTKTSHVIQTCFC